MSSTRGMMALACLRALGRGVVPEDQADRAAALIHSSRPDHPRPETLVENGMLTREQLEERVAEIQAESPPAFPRQFGNKYELLGYVTGGKRGGMGEVLLAWEESLERYVAIKVIRAEWAFDREFLHRFRKEATVMARVSHRNIVHVYEHGECGGQHFISMELVVGSSLDQVIRHSKLSVDESVGLLEKVARAVHHANQQGVIHRDLKPQNILVDTLCEPRVTDFGLAKDLSGDSLYSQTGVALGTRSYMSPEQAQGQWARVRAPSDVYSLGAVLYEMLTREPPFEFRDESDSEWRRIIAQENPVPPRKLNADVTAEVETICLKCLEKESERRYPSAEELADDVQRYRQGEDIRARSSPVWYRAKRFVRRHKFAAVLVAAVLAVVVAAFGPRCRPRTAEGWPFDAAEAKRRQSATAHAVDMGPERTLDLGDGVKLILVLIPRGEFMMGTPRQELPTGRPQQGLKHSDDETLHCAIITLPFWLSKYEITQQQYERVMGASPSEFKGPDRPVETVSWHDAQAFCQKLSEVAGGNFRLPTEAEWEYACRAGSAAKYCFGDSPELLSEYAWYGNAAGTQPVGQKKPNAWGLHDMHGNVIEWCLDWYGPYPTRAVTHPRGPAAGDLRVLRGAAYQSYPQSCRSASRGRDNPERKAKTQGFRVAQSFPRDTRFRVTERRYRATQEDFDQIARGQFGPGYRLADWDDVKAHETEFRYFAYLIDMKAGDDMMVSRHGERFWYDPNRKANRQYMIERADRRVPRYFLVHDHIDDHFIILGSWITMTKHILCIKRDE